MVGVLGEGIVFRVPVLLPVFVPVEGADGVLVPLFCPKAVTVNSGAAAQNAIRRTEPCKLMFLPAFAAAIMS